MIIYNGADYDPWMERLLEVTPKPERAAIVAADLMHKKAGDNPHLWYDPVDDADGGQGAVDDAQRGRCRPCRQITRRGLKPSLPRSSRWTTRSPKFAVNYAGTAVAATEPVFGYMAAALHLTMLEREFPARGHEQYRAERWRPRRIRERSQDTQDTGVILQQASLGQDRATISSVWRAPPIFRWSAVTETCPPGLSYQNWMLSELNETESALGGPSS